MADSAKVRSGMDTLIAENWSSTVMDTLFNVMPKMQLFFGRNQNAKRGPIGLGIPDAGLVLTGVKTAKTRMREILSARIYQPIIHHLLPSEGDGKVMGLTDNMPKRSGWENASPAKRFKRPAVKFCELSDPCKVPNEDIRNTKKAAAGERNGWEAIGDLLRVENSDVLGQHTKRWNQLLNGTYTGTVASTSGAPSDEDADKWDAIHSIQHALSNTGIYCGVDRDVVGNEWWKGNTVSAATPAVFRDLIRYANYSVPLYDGTLGIKAKGGMLDALVVGNDLFPIALAEAEAKQGLIIQAGQPVPEMGQFGFKQDIVKIDNTFIIPDPEVPAGHVQGLNMATWTAAIHPDANFKQSTPTDQSDIEGGDDARTWTIRTKLLLVCEVPNQNTYWTNVG
jgi:cell wall assembly regulator SMI1